MSDGASLILRGGLHFCLVDEAYVFLDLDAQRYFLLPAKAAARFHRFLHGATTDNDREWLVRSRLICRGDEAPEVPRSDLIVPEPRAAIEAALPRAEAALTLRFILAQTLARRRLRQQSLSTILGGLRASDKAGGLVTGVRLPADPSAPTLLRALAAFRASERFWNAVDQCLPRGIALFTGLRRLGYAPTLVIGVSLPFAAHCWVQIGDCVVSDSLDRVRSFTPIFSL